MIYRNTSYDNTLPIAKLLPKEENKSSYSSTLLKQTKMNHSPKTTPTSNKSTTAEIRQRFDGDVERFSQLETGQSATIDAPLAMELVTKAATAVSPHAVDLLDVGCGAGNYSLKLLQRLPHLNVTLVDLSLPMLQQAEKRITPVTSGTVTTLQTDLCDLQLEPASVDIILASAVLHHLRSDDQWEAVFKMFHTMLRPGGSVWIFDLIECEMPEVRDITWNQYSEYLVQFKDEAYRDHVFEYIEKEDSPRSLIYQLNLLQQVGFSQVELLHKNSCFAAFGAKKAS